MTRFTGMIVLGAVVYATVSFLQWRAMKQQTEIAQQAMTIGTRAYVGVHSIETKFKEKQIVVWLENIGKIPAKHIVVFASTATPKGSHPFDIHATNPLDLKDVELFPGNFRFPVLVSIKDFTPEDEGLIYSGVQILIVGITISYDDGFGETVQSVAVFQYVPPPNEKWIPAPTEGKKQTNPN